MPTPLRAALCLVLLGCIDTPSRPNAPSPFQISVADGLAQVAAAGTPLPRPVVVVVRDATGAPLEQVQVEFAVIEGGGRLLNLTGITDRDGRTSAVWLLGTAGRSQQLRVASERADPIIVTATVSDGMCRPAECPDRALTHPEPFHLLTLPTYDGSGQAVHPDLMDPGELPLELVFTPYPGGNALLEDPSLVVSANARHWRVPQGVVNPLARSTAGHLSDPDLVRDPLAGTQFLYYREVAGGRNRIHLMTSANGEEWLAAGVVLDVPSHRALSPAVVHAAPHAPWAMWSVNAGSAGCSAQATVVERRTAVDGKHWGEAQPTDLAQPGQVIWHLDVQWIPGRQEYWALYNSYPEGGTCVTQALFLARSSDGLHWSVPESPLMVAGRVPAFEDVVYRGTFRLSPDGEWVELIISGADYVSPSYNWLIGRMVVSTQEVIYARIDSEAGDASWRRPSPTQLPPPEPFDQQ